MHSPHIHTNHEHESNTSNQMPATANSLYYYFEVVVKFFYECIIL